MPALTDSDDSDDEESDERFRNFLKSLRAEDTGRSDKKRKRESGLRDSDKAYAQEKGSKTHREDPEELQAQEYTLRRPFAGKHFCCAQVVATTPMSWPICVKDIPCLTQSPPSPSLRARISTSPEFEVPGASTAFTLAETHYAEDEPVFSSEGWFVPLNSDDCPLPKLWTPDTATPTSDGSAYRCCALAEGLVIETE